MLAAVTGVFSYSGRFIAEELLARGHQVLALGRREPPVDDPLAARVAYRPLALDDGAALTAALDGCDVLFNTYWIRFEHAGSTFGQAVERSERLLQAARSAGIARVVHLSVSNASLSSPFAYFRGKAQVEEAVRGCGCTWAILRPTLIFGGRQEILVNNIAWLLRRSPVFLLPDGGGCRLQPVAVLDVARSAVGAGERGDDVVLDLAGPETFTFADFAGLIKRAVGSRARLVSAPSSLAFHCCTLAGLFLRDTLLGVEELGALLADLLVCEEATTPTRFSDWLSANAGWLGRRYASELRRNWQAG